jgi:hypothetical protein
MDDAEEIALRWLSETADGQAFTRRMGRAQQDIIDGYRRYIDHYIADPDLARLRLEVAQQPGGMVDRTTLRRLLKEGKAPNVVHGQETWKIPRTAKQLFETAHELPARLVLQEPTLRINRIPMAENIYRDEVRQLVRAGLEPEIAREIAEEKALDITNAVMFNLNDESRFAQPDSWPTVPPAPSAWHDSQPLRSTTARSRACSTRTPARGTG